MTAPRQRAHHALITTTLATLLALVCAPVSAQLAPDDPDAINYKKAVRLVEDDAAQAYELAKSLAPFKYTDELRLKLLGDAALSSGNAPEAVESLLDYAKRADSSKAAFAARLDAAELLAVLGEGDRADALLDDLNTQRKKLSGRYSTRRYLSARVVRLRHDLAHAAGDTKRAKNHARELLITLPNETATLREGLVMTPDDLSYGQRFARAKALYQSWAYKESREEFQRFIKDKTRSETAKWHIAQIGLNKERDDFATAEKYFGELARGTGKYADESLYQYARSLMRQERYEECIRELDNYERRFPSGSRIELIYYYRGWLFYDRRENKKAIKGFKAYIKRYGRKGRRTTYIHGFLAWAYMRESQWKDAIGAWDDLIGFGNPVVAGKAMYWKAHAYKELGDNAKALESLDQLRKRYPVSYYGVLGEQLRARLEGKDPSASKIWWPEGAGTYDDSPRVSIDDLPLNKLSASAREAFRRAQEYAALGEKRQARQALSPIYSTLLKITPSHQKEEWVHALGYLVDDYNKMWKLGARSTISYLPPVPDSNELRSVMAYPRAYRDVVDDVAAEFELPPYLIWAIMRQESRYKPGAISHTDAVGALQMIPKTAKLVARDLGIEYNLRTFHYPEVGFRFSGFYMRKLLDTFGGLFSPMAGSYNSGPHVIARWFRRNPDASFPWLIEEFEYNEGRNYSRKVTEHLVRYVFMYEQDKGARDALFERMFPLDRDITLPDDIDY